MRGINNLLKILFVVGLFACGTSDSGVLDVQYFHGQKNQQYLFLEWDKGCLPELTLERPSFEDESIALCIPLTAPGEITALRYFHCLGTDCADSSLFQSSMPAMLEIASDRIGIVSVGSAKAASSLAGQNKDLVQLFPVLINGKADDPDRIRKFQCRAIIEFNDGRIGLMESGAHQNLKDFSQDLIDFGVKHAVLTITHRLDEGWYRYGKSRISLGRLKSETRHQSNWLVIRKP